MLLAPLALKQPPIELAVIDPRPPAHGHKDRQEKGQVDEVERVGLVHGDPDELHRQQPPRVNLQGLGQ